MGERARGNRFAATAAWFIAGATAGGVGLGALAAALAIAVSAAGPSADTVAALAAGAALLGAIVDARVGGLRLPGHRRQVNERWLDQFRHGVYGFGFGFQIGAGLPTYIMTAGVYLVVVLGALTGDPWRALALGTVFGGVRGLAVLAGRGIRTPAGLADFHRRFDALGEPSRRGMIVVEAVAAVTLAVAPWLPALAVAAAAVAVTAIGGTAIWMRSASRHRRASIGRDADRRRAGAPTASPLP